MGVRIAVIGMGLIGPRHAQAVRAAPQTTLACIVDPSEAAAEHAQQFGVPHLRSIADMVTAGGVDGVIIATPNLAHKQNALDCIAAGLPALIEKPLAADLAGAEAIVAAGRAAGVALLTGHHRRHNPLIEKAKEVIENGDLGTVTSVNAMTWFHKPDPYFDIAWRRQTGAGPIYLNLSHDIDLLRHFCGEVAELHAMQSNMIRGHEVEETAVITLRFVSGALATLNVSDTIVAPWSWELTARENPAYPATDQICYQIGGTHGSLSLPALSVWSNGAQRGWWEPISQTRLPHMFDDPLVQQVRQFAAVIRGDAAPLVSAQDGLKTQYVIEAIKRAAASGQLVRLVPE